MAANKATSALIVHGGAGTIGSAKDRVQRRRAMIDAVKRGAAVLRRGASALDAVCASVTALEDHPLFNAGYGSLLNSEGVAEMDASVMVAQPPGDDGEAGVRSGAVAVVTRVRNPVLAARVVMERTRHLLMAGTAAERFLRRNGIPLCKPDELVSDRARERWRARIEHERHELLAAGGHGTVGAAAIDIHGHLAAATSTGGVPGKLPGRVGDSAIYGAGVFASGSGAASATGHGEAIIRAALCRETIEALEEASPMDAARLRISASILPQGAEAGIIVVDRKGRLGYAHCAETMEVGIFDARGEIRHVWVKSIAREFGSSRRVSDKSRRKSPRKSNR